jgi:acetyl esterase/lipase
LRCAEYVSLGAVLLVAGVFFFHWLKIKGTKVIVSSRQPDAVVLSTTPQEMRLWPGKAPGSENWTQQESETKFRGERFLRNVVDPSLTAYFPPTGTANGTSMIVCPGGAFYLLSFKNEGADVAHFLNSLGISAFVLHYRLNKTDVGFFSSVKRRFQAPGGSEPVTDVMMPLILADGQRAVRIVRSHAAQWGLDPHRIGVIGFSSGGYLTITLALNHDTGSMPDFAAPIYAVAPDLSNVKPDPIPMFIACAADDPVAAPKPNCIREFDFWHDAGLPVELHVFAKGGHGFALKKQNLPSDAWPELFEHWLKAQGYLSRPAAK